MIMKHASQSYVLASKVFEGFASIGAIT